MDVGRPVGAGGHEGGEMSERGAGSVLTVAVMTVVIFVGLAVLGAAQIDHRSRTSHGRRRRRRPGGGSNYLPAGGRGTLTDGGGPAAVAEANGARLISCQCSQVATFEPRQVEVTVVFPVDLPMLGRRWVEASSAAEFVP